ncbi:adenylate/guanylate cyclase domain-containing protein [Psychroserpens sp. XS_ASV72]|uniref:adenylate/guanylate cyclase domain-containing protein n=1 Tax=Psychroserpens sp. XS_ASV72 TaxID=3241293 RepID=UPI00351103C5
MSAQDQDRADSLKQQYREGAYDISESKILTLITENETNPDSILVYADILIDKAESFDKKSIVSQAYTYGHLARGNAMLSKGYNSEAIEAFLKSLDYAEKAKDKRSISFLQIAIADTYAVMENHESAGRYYEKGIALLRKEKDNLNLAIALLNCGDWLITTKNYDKALEHFEESSELYEGLNHKLGLAYNYGNIGIVHAEQGKDELAEDDINKAMHILEELKDFYPMSVYLTYLADIYAEKGNFELAFKYAERSLELAEVYGLKEQISDANLKLSQLHEASGNYDKAFQYYQTHIIYRDSVRNIQGVQKISNALTSKAEKEAELEREKRKTQRIILWSTVGVSLLIALLAFSLFKTNKIIKTAHKAIAEEKQRSDKLLLNILPEETAQELKDKGKVKAKKYPKVTVLFSDFKGFTSYAENLLPEQLVETIDHYFSKFDLIMEKYGLEKIKTIGDAYMAAGGLSLDDTNQAHKMILAAREMIAFVKQVQHDEDTTAAFDIRIGINTGSVVAGVVGTKKFAYDIWGDTVNVASRMETNSEPGRINISESTYQLIKDDFECEYRGELEVKNRGQLKMYFVKD